MLFTVKITVVIEDSVLLYLGMLPQPPADFVATGVIRVARRNVYQFDMLLYRLPPGRTQAPRRRQHNLAAGIGHNLLHPRNKLGLYNISVAPLVLLACGVERAHAIYYAIAVQE